MRKIYLFSFILFIYGNIFLSAFGLFMEGGIGLNIDQNVGLGYVVDSKGSYTGVGAGIVFGEHSYSDFLITIGINIDFLIKPEMGFVRGEERYEVQNMADTASLRLMPYLQVSKNIVSDWLYMGFGLGYSNTGLYFSMRPILYDSDYTSYHLSSNAVTPTFFIRAYTVGGLYFSLSYEVDIVRNGELKRVAGDPLAGFNNIDGATDIKGVHHRARLVIGYVLGFDL
jgi:hypothetical protein